MSLNILGKAATGATMLTINNAIIGGGTYMTLGPVFKGRYATEVTRGADGCTPMHQAMEVDGDLVFCADWAYASAHVSRIANNGAVTRLYTDGYTNLVNLAVNKTRKRFYAGSPIINEVREYDYSNAAAGGSTVTYVGTRTSSNTGAPTNAFACGYYYMNGMYCCGDYVYFCRQGGGPAVNTVERWNSYTNTYSTIAVVRGHGGTIFNGSFTYDADTDRLYQTGISGSGGIYVVANASYATANAFQMTLDATLATNNVMPEVYAKGNTVIAFGYATGSIASYDITNCLRAVGDGAATAVPTAAWTNANNFYVAGWAGIHGVYRPTGLDIALVTPDRGIARMGGWLNVDNGDIVGSPTTPTYTTARPYMADYAMNWKRVTTANGTNYWVYSAYYEDYGALLRVLPDNTGPRLENSWEHSFGSYAFSPAANVYAVTITADGAIAPAGCTLTFYISSDGGTNWQTVAPNVPTDCNIIGTSIRIKVVGTGTDAKSSYVRTTGALVVTLSDQPTGYTPQIAQRFKLAGVN